MRFTLTIDCDNAAFGDYSDERCGEIGRILGELADKLRAESGSDTQSDVHQLRDSNGNTVGRAGFIASDDDAEFIADSE